MRSAISLVLLSLAVAAVPAAQPPMQPPAAKPATSDADVEALIAKTLDRDPKTAAEATASLVELGPTAMPVLTQGLWSDAATTRRACVLVLGEMGGDARSAAPSLVRVLQDDNGNDIRLAAARSLGAIGAHSAIPALTKALKDESAGVRLAAADSLISLGADTEAVIPVLTKALKSAQVEEKLYAIKLLGDLGPEAASAVIALQGALSEGDALTVGRIAQALGRIGPEAKNAMPVLTEKVKDDQNGPLFRVNAAIALWRVQRDESAVTLMRDSLASEKNFRAQLYNALWRADQSKETTDALAKHLSEDALIELAPEAFKGVAKDLVPKYAKKLKDLAEKGFMIDPAEAPVLEITTLGRIGPDAKEALPPLMALAKAKHPLSFQAAMAVYRIDPKADNALALAAFLEDKEHRLVAAEALKQFRPTAKAVAIELLVALDGTDDELRLTAAVALWRIEKNASALKTLTKLLRSSDAKLRERAALEVGFEFGADAKASVPDLVKRLFDARSGVRSTAAEALGRIGVGARDAAPALVAILEGDEPAYVHSAACEALGRIEPLDKEPAVAALKHKLEHPAPLVRAHAALALALVDNNKTGQEEAVRGLTSRSHYVRITSAEAIYRINKDGRAVPLLVRALEESNLTGLEGDNERYMAARALGRIGNDAKIAISELVKMIDHRDEALASAARTAITQIDPDEAKKRGIK